ncbi:MAG: hypothetical protein ACI9PP_000185 [Halobacteriales archaeon]|jgi:hypothetical protein
MRRRYLLRGGTIMAVGSLAGCIIGDLEERVDGSDGATDTEPEDDSDPEPSDGSEDGDVSFSVEPKASEIKWAEPYSVTVTVKAGEDPPPIVTQIIYERESDSQWSGDFSNTQQYWTLGADKSTTKTFEMKPPGYGDFTLGLLTVDNQEVVETWDLTVQQPRAAFGEPISYYDGLDMTVDAEVHDSLEFELDYGEDNDEYTGMFSVSVKDGKWLKINIIAENKGKGKVGLPGKTEFSGLAGGTQLEQNQPRALGEHVGKESIYVIGDGPSDINDARMEMHKSGVVQQDGYWYPESDLIAGAREEGWLVYAVQEDLSEDSVIEIRLNRQSGPDVRAIWTNG